MSKEKISSENHTLPPLAFSRLPTMGKACKLLSSDSRTDKDSMYTSYTKKTPCVQDCTQKTKLQHTIDNSMHGPRGDLTQVGQTEEDQADDITSRWKREPNWTNWQGNVNTHPQTKNSEFLVEHDGEVGEKNNEVSLNWYTLIYIQM